MSRIFQVTGPPGTGKTTYLSETSRHAAQSRGGDAVVLASLTRAAAAEIAGRDLPIPPENVGTLHALCYRALGQPKLAEPKAGVWNEAIGRERPSWTLTDPSAGKRGVDDAPERPGGGEGDVLLAELGVLRATMAPPEAWPVRVQAFAKRWGAWKAECGLVDFTDLLELAMKHVPRCPGNPEVMLGDEAQDWSQLESRLFREHWGQHAETVVLVADPDQSIYEWRGADPRLFLDQPVPDENRRLLEQSYRVPRKIVDHALAWVRKIEGRADVAYQARADDGAVLHTTSTCRLLSRHFKEDLEVWLAEGKSVMLLASCGYMLRAPIRELRDWGIPFWNPYRTKQGAWNPLRRGTRKTKSGADRVLAFLVQQGEREWHRDEIALWARSLQTGVLRRGLKTLLEKTPEKLLSNPWRADELAMLFTSETHAEKALDGDLRWFEESLTEIGKRSMRFAISVAAKRGVEALSKAPQITVGTIHSVKGGQADVVVLFPDLSMQAMRGWESRREHDALVRLFYVAMTRARETLVLADPATPLHVRLR